jgi:hypothetical protein
MPRFCVREVDAFLRCGMLAHGFARVWCEACGKDDVVAFSCKGRGFCPSCGARRMTDTAAWLVDRVIPDEAPVRQWVLSLPVSAAALVRVRPGCLCSGAAGVGAGGVGFLRGAGAAARPAAAADRCGRVRAAVRLRAAVERALSRIGAVAKQCIAHAIQAGSYECVVTSSGVEVLRTSVVVEADRRTEVVVRRF